MKRLLFAALAAVLWISHAGAQTLLTTSLTFATSDSSSQLTLASTSGLNKGDAVLIDGEEMRIGTIAGRAAGVYRGIDGTKSTGHAAGATVYAGNPSLFLTKTPTGNCSAVSGTTFVVLSTASTITCSGGGTWNSGTAAVVTSSIVTNGLIADYWFSNCDGSQASGTTVADCSGNGNNTSFTQSSGSPSYTAKGLYYANAAAGQPVVIPTAVGNQMQTIQVYADSTAAALNSNYLGAQAFVSNGANAILWAFEHAPYVASNYFTWGGLYADWNGSLTNSVDAAVGPNLFTLVGANTGSGQTDALYIGASPVSGYYGTAKASMVAPSARTGSYQLFGNNASAQFSGNAYRVLIYNRALAAWEVAQNDAAINLWVARRGVKRGVQAAPNTADYTLTCVGDSITQGQGVTAGCSSTNLAASLSQTFTYFNMGLSSQTLGNIHTGQAKYASTFNPSGTNFVWLWAGTNDLCSNGANNSPTLNVAQTYTALRETSQWLHAQGARVVILPMLTRVGYVTAQSASCETLGAQYNALIAQGWATFADAYVWQLATDAHYAPNATNANAYTNTTYFQGDQIHPTALGQQQIAGYVANQINALLAGVAPLGSWRENLRTVTASYSAAAGDTTILCDATSGAATITLPTAVGLQGKAFQVKKTDSSPNACTIATTSSQTIDGASTAALSSQYASKKVESDGANWAVVQ